MLLGGEATLNMSMGKEGQLFLYALVRWSVGERN